MIFVRRHRGPSGYHDEVFHDDEHVVRTLTKLLDDSASAHRSLDPAEGLQDAQLDDGARVHIAHGDITRGGHVLVNIRKFTGIPFRSLDELVKRGMLSGQVAGLLIACRAPNVPSENPNVGDPASRPATSSAPAASEPDDATRRPSRRVASRTGPRQRVPRRSVEIGVEDRPVERPVDDQTNPVEHRFHGESPGQRPGLSRCSWWRG